MAKTTTSEAPKMIMPDVASFDAPNVDNSQQGPVGRVEGLDYETWAVAIVDLDQPNNRVEGDRARLTAKGYKPVDGKPLVGGFPNPEVWVIPRKNYEANRARKSARIDAAVASGQMMEFANRQTPVTRGR